MTTETLPTPSASVPMFEIDQMKEFGRFLLRSELDIVFNFKLLKKQRSVLALYIGNTGHFVPSSVVDIDEESKTLYLDLPPNAARDLSEVSKEAITLIGSTADRVKIQARLGAIRRTTYDGIPTYAVALPQEILRLQRREFFRIETPRMNPLRCTVNVPIPGSDEVEAITLSLNDISGGGLSLMSKVDQFPELELGHIFHDCHLEIPGEAVLSVNLRVCEVLIKETLVGEPLQRIGCEFISLPSNRQSVIERYITRLARERKPGALQ